MPSAEADPAEADTADAEVEADAAAAADTADAEADAADADTADADTADAEGEAAAAAAAADADPAGCGPAHAVVNPVRQATASGRPIRKIRTPLGRGALPVRFPGVHSRNSAGTEAAESPRPRIMASGVNEASSRPSAVSTRPRT